MSEQTSGTLPLAASITHLKLEAKALRAAFDGGDQAVRERIAVHLTPPPDALAHTQALFVVAREYGFPSWPVLKQHIQRRMRTVYSDVDGVAVAIAQLLGDASVTVAQTIEDALDSASEVLVLDLHRRLDHLEPERLAKLKYRKLVLLGPEADWLCRGLELEIGDGYVTREAVPLRIADSALLAGRLGESTRHAAIEPFARQPAIGSLFDRGKPHLHFSYVEDAMKLGATGGFVDVILARAEPGGERHAVVARQANCVVAGVAAAPTEWSRAYREFFGCVVVALAERELEEPEPAVVPRQVQPPGIVRFDLEPLSVESSDDGTFQRLFYFQFDQPTVMTATLRHHGSDAMMLLFQGGRKQLYFTREDTESGETLTIATTIRQPGIDALAGRYWTLDVTNFDQSRRAWAELTVRYDALAGGAIRPVPSDASFEHFHWFAERLPESDGARRRAATAQAFGFDSWRTLQSHVAWSAVQPTRARARDCDIYFAGAQEKFGESFGLTAFLEFASPHGEYSEDLQASLVAAQAFAEAQRHASIGVEHLLLLLLDNPVAVDVLAKSGADLVRLRQDLRAWLESPALPAGGDPVVTRELFGVLWRADSHSALGRSGRNAANVLIGVFAEQSHARELLFEQGLSRADVNRYLAHGIAKTSPLAERSAAAGPTSATAVLAAEVEIALQAAYANAEDRRHEAFGVEHLAEAVLDLQAVGGRVGSRAKLRGIRDELGAFVDATPIRPDSQTRPTRALNRVMQKAVARSRSADRRQADAVQVLRGIASETGTFAADVLRRYEVRLSD